MYIIWRPFIRQLFLHSKPLTSATQHPFTRCLDADTSGKTIMHMKLLGQRHIKSSGLLTFLKKA